MIHDFGNKLFISDDKHVQFLKMNKAKDNDYVKLWAWN